MNPPPPAINPFSACFLSNKNKECWSCVILQEPAGACLLFLFFLRGPQLCVAAWWQLDTPWWEEEALTKLQDWKKADTHTLPSDTQGHMCFLRLTLQVKFKKKKKMYFSGTFKNNLVWPKCCTYKWSTNSYLSALKLTSTHSNSWFDCSPNSPPCGTPRGTQLSPTCVRGSLVITPAWRQPQQQEKSQNWP